MEENSIGTRVSVRWAEDSDNESILELSPRCAQQGMITMYPDRSPQFNRLHKLIDPESYHVIARNPDKAVGLLGILHTSLYFKEMPFRTAYLLDFKVDPDYRLGMTAFRMVKPMIDSERQSGTRMALATLLKNNEAPMVFTKGRGGFPASLYLGDNRVINFIPLRKMHVDSRFTVRQATPADIPELVALYNRFYGSYLLAPRIDEATLQRYMTEIEGLGIDRFYLACEGGAIKAVVAAWDAIALKRYRVTQSNYKVKAISGLVTFLSRFMKMPEPIRINEPLRQLTLVMYAHDRSPAALTALFRHVNNLNLGGDYSFLQVHIHQDDPAVACLRGFTGISVYTEIHLFTDTLNLAREIQEQKGMVHLEFPTYI